MRRFLPLLLVTVACGPSVQTATLPVSATFGGQDAACGTEHPSGTTQRAVRLADARLFLSGFEVRDADGAWVPATLPDSDPWQHGGVALLDLEDGSTSCSDSGNDAQNLSLDLEFPSDAAAGVRFALGVPFDLNHTDSATAPAPLNVPAMFWTWQGGYKFLRVDVVGDAEDGPARWNVHLGSTQCAADAPTQAPTEPCGRPNLATITLDDLDLTAHALHIDLDALLAGADLATNEPETPPGCMSAPGEPQDCAPVFQALGLDFETGLCVDGCQDQTVFSAVDR